MRQNTSPKAQSKEVEMTHQRELKASQRSRAAKRSYQAVSRATEKVLKALGTSASMERTHQVVIQAQEGAWSCRGSRKASRSIGTVGRL